MKYLTTEELRKQKEAARAHNQEKKEKDLKLKRLNELCARGLK